MVQVKHQMLEQKLFVGLLPKITKFIIKLLKYKDQSLRTDVEEREFTELIEKEDKRKPFVKDKSTKKCFKPTDKSKEKIKELQKKKELKKKRKEKKNQLQLNKKSDAFI